MLGVSCESDAVTGLGVRVDWAVPQVAMQRIRLADRWFGAVGLCVSRCFYYALIVINY